MRSSPPAIWFPTVRTGTGTDVFTERMATELCRAGLRAEITWLPLRAEYAPWTVPTPRPPPWASICHINTWTHPRFIPSQLPVVATLHHSIHDPALRPYKGWLRSTYHRNWIAPVERRVLHRADHVVAVSRFVANTARRTLREVPIDVIYNGIDTERFQPGKPKQLPHNNLKLLYVGSWMTRKGVDLLAPIMRELGDGYELHYTGGPAAATDKSKMPPNMYDMGRLSSDDVITAMQNSDAFLFPSRSEGLPLAAIEAMSCGLPVIAMRGTSVEEVVSHGKTGFLCPHDDIHAFSQAAQAIAANQDLHLRLRKLARERIVASFRISQMVDAYLETYRNLAKEKNERRHYDPLP